MTSSGAFDAFGPPYQLAVERSHGLRQLCSSVNCADIPLEKGTSYGRKDRESRRKVEPRIPGFVDNTHCPTAEVTEVLAMGDGFADHGKPTRACAIPYGIRRHEDKGMYGEARRESIGLLLDIELSILCAASRQTLCRTIPPSGSSNVKPKKPDVSGQPDSLVERPSENT